MSEFQDTPAKIESIIRDLGGVPGFEQQPAAFISFEDKLRISFMRPRENGADIVSLDISGMETMTIPDRLFAEYIAAKLALCRVRAKVFDI